MSLLGNLVGHAAATVGRAYDYATPGSGTSALTNAGRAVYDPNVVLSNPSGIFTKAPAFTAAKSSSSSTRPASPKYQAKSATTTYSGGTSSGSDTGPAYDPSELAYLDQQQSLYDRLLKSADRSLSSGVTDLSNSTTAARNKANSQRSRALEDFGIQREDTTRGQQGALDKVDTNSRTLRDSLMRILGLAASGGSAFDVADNAVARDASKNRAGVQEDYASNWRGLDLSERRANEDYQSLLDEIEADRRSKEQSLRGGVLDTKQGLEQALAQIAADRARLLGGDQLAASRPYVNNYLSMQDQIDSLPSRFRTAVSARDLNVQTPTLRDYMVDRASIGANQSQDTSQAQYSPYAQFLNKEDDNSLFA